MKFTYSYQALIKAAIALVAKQGYKIRSVPGHHVRLLMKASEILGDPDCFAVGDAMRSKRNEDFYGGGAIVTRKEAADYLDFVRGVAGKIERAV